MVSGANFGFLVLAARGLRPDDFGLVSLVSAGAVSLVGLAQSANVEPLTVAVSASGRWVTTADRRRVGRRQARFALVAGMALAVAAALAGVRYRGPLLLLAAGLLPALLLDAMRTIDYCNGELARALRRDLWWTGALSIGLGAAFAMGRGGGPVPLLTAYLGAAAVVSLPNLAATFRPSRTANGLTGAAHDDVGEVDDAAHRRRFVTEYATNQGASQLTYYLATAAFGLGATGALRAAQSLFGPLNVALSSMRLFLAPRLARTLAEDPAVAAREWRRLLRWMGAASVLAPLSVVLAVGVVGPAMFAGAWPGLVPLIAPFGLQYVSLGIGMAGVVALRSLADSRASMWCRVLQAVITAIATVAGCAWGSLVGLCWLIAGGMVIAGLTWLVTGWVRVRARVAHSLAMSSAPSPPADPDRVVALTDPQAKEVSVW